MSMKQPWTWRVGRRRLLRGGAVGALGVTAWGMAGCSPAAPAPAPTPVTAAGAPPAPTAPPTAGAPSPVATRVTAKYGGKFTSMATATSRDLDPHKGGLTGAALSGAMCYSQLLMFKWGADAPPPSYVPIGDLAESWTQPDDVTYVFKLRPGVKWHNVPPVNGRELVADDIVYSYQRLRDLKVSASLLTGLAKMETPDRTTLKLTLDKPNPDFLLGLADFRAKVVARELVERNGDLTGPPVIGSGPWLYEDYVAGQRFAARRNPDYYLKGRPYADSIETFVAADGSALTNALRTKAANVIGSGLATQAANDLLKSIPGLQAQWIMLDANPDELGVRVTEEPFSDLRVRQAIDKAIDRKAAIDGIFGGRAVLSAGIVLPSLDWALPAAELQRLRARDVEGAKRLIKEAGKEAGFDVECVVPTYRSGDYITMAELFQANLREIGVRITLKTADSVGFYQLVNSGSFKMYIGNAGSLGGTNANLYGFHYTGGALNRAGYANPQLDKLIDQQATMARDPDGRRKVLEQIQRLIIEQAYIMNIADAQAPVLYHAEVKDLYPPGNFNSTSEFWSTAWIDK
jgi:ABC-type transport system substrate-binding protein